MASHFLAVIRPCRAISRPNNSHEMVAYTITDPSSCLTVANRHSGLKDS
uniref:Uncharacterized protein n=1 Tax=Anguilla anguilla TaxID=7936 RepID=A0A0E9PFJ9_ANGAN